MVAAEGTCCVVHPLTLGRAMLARRCCRGAWRNQQEHGAGCVYSGRGVDAQCLCRGRGKRCTVGKAVLAMRVPGVRRRCWCCEEGKLHGGSAEAPLGRGARALEGFGQCSGRAAILLEGWEGRTVIGSGSARRVGPSAEGKRGKEGPAGEFAPSGRVTAKTVDPCAAHSSATSSRLVGRIATRKPPWWDPGSQSQGGEPKRALETEWHGGEGTREESRESELREIEIERERERERAESRVSLCGPACGGWARWVDAD